MYNNLISQSMTVVYEILLMIVSDEEDKTGGSFGKYSRGSATGVPTATAMVPYDGMYYSSNEYESSHTVKHN